MAAESFLARLDRAPLNRFHWRLLVVAGFGWMFDAMDVILIAFLLTPIRTEFGLDWNMPLPSGEPALANEVKLVAELYFVREA